MPMSFRWLVDVKFLLVAFVATSAHGAAAAAAKLRNANASSVIGAQTHSRGALQPLMGFLEQHAGTHALAVPVTSTPYPPAGAGWTQCSAANWGTAASYKDTHDCMGQVQKKSSNWGSVLLGDLSVAGSHDAGIFWSPSHTVKYVTQAFNIREQLCRGVRFFDIRLKKQSPPRKLLLRPSATDTTGTWKTLHPGWSVLPNGWSDTWDDIVKGIKEFTNNAAHQHEVIYIRIKLIGKQLDLATVLTRDDGASTPSLKPWLVQKVAAKGDKIMQYTMADLTTAKGAAGAKVVLMVYKWEPAGDYFFKYTGSGASRTVSGEFSSTGSRAKVFTNTCAGRGALGESVTLACSAGEHDGQFGLLKEWKDSFKASGVMHVSYLTLTFGNIRANTAEHLGGVAKDAAAKNDYLLNDYLLMSTYNFGSPGHVVMSDFCGDPAVWGGARFKGTVHAAGAGDVKEKQTEGNGLVAALIAYNVAKVTNVGFIKCRADAPADKKVAGVCGTAVNSIGLQYSDAAVAKGSAPKAIGTKTGMIRDPTKADSDAVQAVQPVAESTAEEAPAPEDIETLPQESLPGLTAEGLLAGMCMCRQKGETEDALVDSADCNMPCKEKAQCSPAKCDMLTFV